MAYNGVVGEFKPFASKFRWTIPQFMNWLNKVKVHDFIDSPSCDSLSLQLGVYRSNSDCTINNLGIHGLSTDSTVICAGKLSILNDQNKSVHEYLICDSSTGSNVYRGTIEFVNLSFIKDPCNRVLVDGALIIEWDLCPDIEISNEECDCDYAKVLDDFETLIDNEQFTDVTFKINGKQIHAHKAILAVRSNVFKAMFTHDMKEKQQNVVELENIDFEVFKEFLRFIYSGKVNDLKNLAKDLLIVSDKYAVDKLKDKCEEMLSDGINVDSVLKYLKIADYYKCPNLKSKALDFISSHLKEIVDKPEFNSFREMDLLQEVLRKVAEKNGKK